MIPSLKLSDMIYTNSADAAESSSNSRSAKKNPQEKRRKSKSRSTICVTTRLNSEKLDSLRLSVSPNENLSTRVKINAFEEREKSSTRIMQEFLSKSSEALTGPQKDLLIDELLPTPRGSLIRTHSFSSFSSRNHDDAKENNQTIIKKVLSPVYEKNGWAICPWMLRGLEMYATEKLQNGVNLDNIIEGFVQGGLLSYLGIHQKLKDGKTTKFLDHLLTVTNAIEFYAKFKKFNKKQRKILADVVCGKEAILCLNLCKKKETLNSWKKHLEKVLIFDRAASQIKIKRISLTPNFDKAHPLSKIGRADILSTFRAMFAFDFMENQPIFFINGHALKCPKWDTEDLKGLQEPERQKYFIAWLMKNINAALTIADEKIALSGAKLICQGAIEKREATDLVNVLEAVFKKTKELYFPNLQEFLNAWVNTLTNSLRELYQPNDLSEAAKSLIIWAQKKFEHYLKDKYAQFTSFDCFEKFSFDYWHRQCLEKIPCFHILQAISFSAYASADTILRNKFCPELMDINAPLRMKYFPTDETRFLINIESTDSNSKLFVVTHVKPYRIVRREPTHYVESGSLKVHWQLRSGVSTGVFSANIWCDALKFDEAEDLENRYQVLAKLSAIK